MGTLLAVCAAIGWAPPALAYQQADVDSGAHARWYVAELPYTIDEDALEAEGIGKKVTQFAAKAAFDAWLQVVCSVCHDPAGLACAPVPCDAHPLGLTMRFDGFVKKAPIGPGCEGGFQPDNACAGISEPAPTCKLVPNGNQMTVVRDLGKWCFSSGTVAMTLVSANQVSGEIADADILLNAAHQTFCAGNCAAKAYDLQNTLTHEAGHFLGLDHSALPEATMFGGAPPQELSKRDLDADDSTGICFSYRQAWQSGGCPVDEEPGCGAVTSGAGSPLPVVALLLWVGLLCWRRRVDSIADP